MAGRSEAGDARTGSPGRSRSNSGGSENSRRIGELDVKMSSIAGELSKVSGMLAQLMAQKSDESGSTEQGATAVGEGARQGVHTNTAAERVPEGAPQSRGEQATAPPAAAGGPGSGPYLYGENSGEVRGFGPQEVRVAAATGLGDSMSSAGDAQDIAYGGGFRTNRMLNVKYQSPAFNGKPSNYLQWSEDFIQGAKGVDLMDHFVGGGVEIPVHDSTKSKADLCREYPPDQVELAFHAWGYLRHALKEEGDRRTMNRAISPQGAFRELGAIYYPDSQVYSQADMEKLMATKSLSPSTPLRPSTKCTLWQTA